MITAIYFLGNLSSLSLPWSFLKGPIVYYRYQYLKGYRKNSPFQIFG